MLGDIFCLHINETYCVIKAASLKVVICTLLLPDSLISELQNPEINPDAFAGEKFWSGQDDAKSEMVGGAASAPTADATADATAETASADRVATPRALSPIASGSKESLPRLQTPRTSTADAAANQSATVAEPTEAGAASAKSPARSPTSPIPPMKDIGEERVAESKGAGPAGPAGAKGEEGEPAKTTPEATCCSSM